MEVYSLERVNNVSRLGLTKNNWVHDYYAEIREIGWPYASACWIQRSIGRKLKESFRKFEHPKRPKDTDIRGSLTISTAK